MPSMVRHCFMKRSVSKGNEENTFKFEFKLFLLLHKAIKKKDIAIVEMYDIIYSTAHV